MVLFELEERGVNPAKGIDRGIGKLPVAQGRKRVAAHACLLGEGPQGAAPDLIVAAVPIHSVNEVGFEAVDGFHVRTSLLHTLSGVNQHIERSIDYPKPMKKRANPEPGKAARQILADNLNRLMESNPQYGSERLVAKMAKIGVGSIHNMRGADRGNATIDNIAKVAAVFGLESWQLLHRDLPKRAMTERELSMYEAIAKAYAALPSLDPPHAKKP